MNLPRADAALETCAKHLDDTQSRNTEIDAILTAYVSAVIYAAFERRAREIVAGRAQGDGSDPHLVGFARTASQRLLRSIKINELSGAAGYFHADCKAQFRDFLDDRTASAWDSIINNRHDVAHEDNAAQVVSTLTFRDLEALYPIALGVLESLEQAIARSPTPPTAAPTPSAPRGILHRMRERVLYVKYVATRRDPRNRRHER